MRSSVNISRNYYEAIKDLPLENQAEIWSAIFEFTLNDIEVELSGVSMTVFKLIKPQLEISNIRSKAGTKQNQKRIKSESKANQKGIKTRTPKFVDSITFDSSVNGNKHNLKLKKDYDLIEKSVESISKFIRDNRPNFVDPYVELWNLFCDKYKTAKVAMVSDGRKRKLLTRLSNPSFDFVGLLSAAKEQTFALESKWFTFDFLIENDTNYIKVMERKYKVADRPAEAGLAPLKP